MPENMSKSILRPDEDGAVDEIVLSCRLLHLERMDDDVWWMGIYRDEAGKEGRVSLFFTVDETGMLSVHVAEDDFGMHDDR